MLSRRTQAALARAMDDSLNHASLNLLAYEYQCEEQIQGTSNKLDKATRIVRSVVESEPKSLLPLAESVLARSMGGRHEYLVAQLEVDGYQLSGSRLVPTTPGPAKLGPEISALEAALADSGLTVAATHFRQACDNFAKGQWESANGQVRSFLEDFFIGLCARLGGKEFKDASAALTHLKDRKLLDGDEWNAWRGFWGSSQTNGPHHGLSDQREALYRLHIATAIGRYGLQMITPQGQPQPAATPPFNF